MFPLNLPLCDIKIVEHNGKKSVFDILRKRYVALTPEEWVRQNFIHYLIEHKGYPASMLANEVSLKLNGMNRRCDSILYSRNLTPRMIVEYKAPSIEITQKVFSQISRYNIVMKVSYLIVSNGLRHFCCKIDLNTGKYSFLKEIPEYKDLKD